MKIYTYVNTSRANADGSFSVFFIVKTGHGRFFVNTGITTCGKMDGMSFPKDDAQWRRKNALLARYYADVDALCLRGEMASLTDAEIKERIQKEVFGVVSRGQTTLADYIRAFATQKRDVTRGIYEVTAKKVEAHDKGATLEKVDGEWLDAFRDYCKDCGMATNGIGKELRNVRAVFNWARRKGLTKNYPFLDYRIAREEREPNNISVDDLRRLRDWPCEPWQQRYVDFFFLSFYLAGMNPVDLLSLKEGCIKNGHLSFVRRKTDKEGASQVRTITLPVMPEAQTIIDRWPSEEGWLLGWMDGRDDYRSFVREANDALKKVGRSWKVKDKVGKLRKMAYEPICPQITMYSARYSFGSIAANDLDISERTIGMCLGHSWSKNVTSRYMANDQRKIDMCVSRVVGYLSGADAAEKTLRT